MENQIIQDYVAAHAIPFKADYNSLIAGEYGEVREIDSPTGDNREIEISARDRADGRPYLFTFTAA